MDFYFDENIAPQIAQAIDKLEEHRKRVRVFSTKEVFGQGVLDHDLIPKVGKANGVLVTCDFQMKRVAMYKDLMQKHNLGLVFTKFPNGAKYWDGVRFIVNKWEDIVKTTERLQPPFAIKVTARGKKPEVLNLWT